MSRFFFVLFCVKIICKNDCSNVHLQVLFTAVISQSLVVTSMYTCCPSSSVHFDSFYHCKFIVRQNLSKVIILPFVCLDSVIQVMVLELKETKGFSSKGISLVQVVEFQGWQIWQLPIGPQSTTSGNGATF